MNVLGMLLDNGAEQCVTVYTLRNRTRRICRVRFETQGLLPKPGFWKKKRCLQNPGFHQTPTFHYQLMMPLSPNRKNHSCRALNSKTEKFLKKSVSPFASFKQGLYSMIIQGVFLETWHLREKARKKCMSRLDTMFTIKPHILACGFSGYRQYKGNFVAILIPRYQSNRSPKYLLCKHA